MDYLTKPSGLEDIGFTKKVRVVDHLKPTDEMIVVAYPYFNVNGELNICAIMILVYVANANKICMNSFILGAEMLAVEELYTKATADSKVPILVFNGELDRIRSGCILWVALKAYYLSTNNYQKTT